jgi:predicted RNase H-like HicB family nuclease
VSVIDKIFGENKADTDSSSRVLEIPVSLRLWQEDGVWNGEAADLPIAVFGETFESAVENLHQAVMSHLEALLEIGKLEETAHILRACARNHRFSLDEMGSNRPFVRFNAGLQNNKVVCIA